ncbi:MAG: DUF1501 domain-containing protein [Planctomycetota bacterium]
MSLHLNPGDAKAYTRRELMGRGAVMASATLFAPAFLQASARVMPRAQAGMTSIPGVDEGRVLVVIQLSGGNDGLNTVVPFGDDNYYKARPGIGIRQNQLLELGRKTPGIGLHPALDGVKELYDEGLCSIVHGVGYPNPNRSHFASMDIWHTADTRGVGDGWLGRYFDSECCGHGAGESGTDDGALTPGIEPPMALGRKTPLALQGRKIKPISFETPDLFRWSGRDVHESLVDPYESLMDRGVHAEDAEDLGSNAAFLMRTALDAQVSSERIRNAVSKRPLASFPNTDLGRQLQMVASMIRAELPTRVYYVTHGGFDTHASQGGANGRHAQLLRQFGDAVRAFYADLKAQENAERVLTMSFSEFGRRVSQNGSGGTDHGTAAPMMLFGPMVRAGARGKHPSLTHLDNGDLRFTADFRGVYTNVLEDWLQTESAAVLGRKFRSARVLRS